MKYPDPHPFAELFPLHAGPSLIRLSDSIRNHGQFEDIVLFEGKVLDGRRRLAACIRAGVKPRYRQFGSRQSDGTDALEFAFEMNYQRRDMSEAERALAAVAYANLKKGYNNSTNPPNGGLGENSPVSQKQAAEKFDVKPRQVERAKQIVDKGVPELQQAVKEEKVSISDAAKITSEPPKVQREAVKEVLAGKASTLAGAVAAKSQPQEDPAKLAQALDAVLERLPNVQTERVEMRTLACDGLKNVAALVRRL